MKLIDRYIKMKTKYPNYVILMKCGNFYNTYYEDAILISNLCDYKIVNNKIGFPKNSLSKIKDILTNKSIFSIIVSKYYIYK